MTLFAATYSLRRQFVPIRPVAVDEQQVVQTRSVPVATQATATNLLTDETTGTPATAASANIHLVVDLSDRQVYVYERDRLKTNYTIAVGQPGWETPVGSYQVLHMLRHPIWQHPITNELFLPGPSNPLGDRWIGFWSGNRSEIGFHGTNEEELIGLAVSHGCIRMRNRDIRKLYEQVREGTPILVRQ
ncbi:MAG: L,D-transpeptidase [Scytolyngbya sp. HA4215-MV1]|nr:L,D-transpeptidase [Scytolyngbya sp. HA4215-MV1]